MRHLGPGHLSETTSRTRPCATSLAEDKSLPGVTYAPCLSGDNAEGPPSPRAPCKLPPLPCPALTSC